MSVRRPRPARYRRGKAWERPVGVGPTTEACRRWPWDAADLEAQWLALADLLYRNPEAWRCGEENLEMWAVWLDGLERLWLTMLAPAGD